MVHQQLEVTTSLISRTTRTDQVSNTDVPQYPTNSQPRLSVLRVPQLCLPKCILISDKNRHRGDPPLGLRPTFSRRAKSRVNQRSMRVGSTKQIGTSEHLIHLPLQSSNPSAHSLTIKSVKLQSISGTFHYVIRRTGADNYRTQRRFVRLFAGIKS